MFSNKIHCIFSSDWLINRMKGHEHHFENLSKLKNIDTKLMYNGVTHTKGLADDEVRILLSFNGYVMKMAPITNPI